MGTVSRRQALARLAGIGGALAFSGLSPLVTSAHTLSQSGFDAPQPNVPSGPFGGACPPVSSAPAVLAARSSATASDAPQQWRPFHRMVRTVDFPSAD